MDYQRLRLGPNRNPLANPQAKRGEYGKTSTWKNNKTDGPQSPAALEFTSTAAEVLTKEQNWFIKELQINIHVNIYTLYNITWKD